MSSPYELLVPVLDRSVSGWVPRVPAVEGCCCDVVHAPLLIGAAERESFMYAADGRRVCPK